jgi:hypothetical protein
MNINNTPKYVVNLKRRKDRLEHIKSEMDYISWDFDLFEAIDKNSHLGCTLSHVEIIKDAKSKNYESVMVIEDDCSFMPYAKSFIKQLDSELKDVTYAILNLSPTHNRPVQISKDYRLLIDTTNFPPMEERHRGVFATNMIVYHKSIYDDVIDIVNTNHHTWVAIDDYIYSRIMLKKQSYCPILPIAPQKKEWSDVSDGMYDNFYTQTYNWNLYSPYKIPSRFLNYEKNQEIKKNKEQVDFIYEG